MVRTILPVILSLPHGGLDIPAEMTSCLAINETDIYNECDLWIDKIFDFGTVTTSLPEGGQPLASISAQISRGLIDLNRPPHDLDNPDGVVKSQTSYGRQVCTRPLTDREKLALVEKYWTPWHERLEKSIADYGQEAKLFLDCHNMAQTGPTTYDHAGESRPLILLSNSGGMDGSPVTRRGTTSCSADYIQEAAAIAQEVFADLELLEPLPGPPPQRVGINRPYPGGYILKQYAAQREERGLPPGMMIEFNRGLYVGNQNAFSPISPPNEERIAVVRELTLRWLLRLLNEL